MERPTLLVLMLLGMLATGMLGRALAGPGRAPGWTQDPQPSPLLWVSPALDMAPPKIPQARPGEVDQRPRGSPRSQVLSPRWETAQEGPSLL